MASTPSYGAWHTSATPDDELRTIFISGFPPDTKERELQNLLRWWPGYEACQLTMKGESALGFALFSTPTMATAARDALQGLVFDLESNSTLRAEMAKKNLFFKKGVVPPAQPLVSPSYDPNKRMRSAEVAPLQPYMQPVGGYPLGSPQVLEPMSSPYPSSYHPSSSPYPPPSSPYPPPSQYTSPYPVPSSPAHFPSPLQHHHNITSPVPYNRGRGAGWTDRDNPPCNTLFVGGLSDRVREDELIAVFRGYPGFRQMKLMRGAQNTACFIDFLDVEAATLAHSSAQGLVLDSSDRGPLRVQFAKTPLGRKREHGGRMGWGGQSSNGRDEERVEEAPPGGGVDGLETEAAVPGPVAAEETAA